MLIITIYEMSNATSWVIIKITKVKTHKVNIYET